MTLPFQILFTDLDGTLLDEATYAYDAARSALAALREQGIPVLFCTSKTFAETVVLQEAMGIEAPFIVENGGAIYFRPGQLAVPPGAGERKGVWIRVGLGIPYASVVASLAAIEARSGIRLRGFSQMDASEIAAACGLTLEGAERAKQREYDEPFLLLDDTAANRKEIARLAAAAGLTWVVGGRFHHLSGGSDKGRAIREIGAWALRRPGPFRSVGLGDSPNDLPMLEAVDLPVVVMRPGGTHHPRLLAALPHALRAPGVGPVGWNAAVLELLAEGMGHDG